MTYHVRTLFLWGQDPLFLISFTKDRDYVVDIITDM